MTISAMIEYLSDWFEFEFDGINPEIVENCYNLVYGFIDEMGFNGSIAYYEWKWLNDVVSREIRDNGIMG